MAIWIKLSVLFMLLSLFFHYSSSNNKDDKSTTSEFTFSDDGPEGDTDVAETQQVSLITTIEYLPVEAKEAQEQGEDLAPPKTEGGEAAPEGDEESGIGSVSHDELSASGKKNSRDLRKKYLRERTQKTQDRTANSKDDLELDSSGHFNATQGKEQAKVNGKKEIRQSDKQRGSKGTKEAADSEPSLTPNEKPQTHRQEFGKRNKGRKKRGSENSHRTSEGDEHKIESEDVNDTTLPEKKNASSPDADSVRLAVRKTKLHPIKNEAQDKETEQEKNESLKEEKQKSEKKYTERKRRRKIRTKADEKTSQGESSKLEAAESSQRWRRRRVDRQNKQNDSIKKDEIGDEPKYGEKIKTKKSKTSNRNSRQEKVKSQQNAKKTQRKRQRKIRHKNEPIKERKQRKIDTALHGKPLSIFIRKEDLHKLKNHKKEDGKYDGQEKHKKHDKSRKNLLHEENNEIWNDSFDKDDRKTLKKPSAVVKVIADEYSSKEHDSLEKDEHAKSYLNPIPQLKQQKTQQVSLISDVEMEHSSTERKKEPKSSGYKHEEGHKAVQYKASGEKVAKGGHSSSGYKKKHQGKHGESHESKFHDKGAKDAKAHHFKKEYHGKYDTGKKKSKGHARGSKGEQEKGFNNKGFKNLHHKLEYSSRKNYYDEDDDIKYSKDKDDFDSIFEKHVNSYDDKHKYSNDHHHSQHGHGGYDFDKEFDEYMKRTKHVYKDNDYHDDHHHYGNKRKYMNSHYHHQRHWRK